MNIITLTRGAVAGLCAGVVMGYVMIGMTGLGEGGAIVEIAHIYGSDSALLGFVMHLVHSILLGVFFALVVRHSLKGVVVGMFGGIIYGFLWWILCSLVITPFILSGVWRIGGGAGGIEAGLSTLPGYLVFGFFLGLLFVVISPAGDTID